jgi:hypothetical protein
MSLISAVSAVPQMYLQDFLSSREKEDASSQLAYTGLASSGANGASGGAAGAYGGSGLASPVAQAAVQRAMEEMRSQGKDRVTFSEIAQYRQQLEEEFSLRVRLDLHDLGLPPETSYSLRMSSEGVISVACDDPWAKNLINRYLAESPQTCEQFGYIQALANVDRARQSPAALSASLLDAKAELQASVVAAFTTDALASGLMDYAAVLADFPSSSATRFYTSLSYTV